jgi:hypothetical protein
MIIYESPPLDPTAEYADGGWEKVTVFYFYIFYTLANQLF